MKRFYTMLLLIIFFACEPNAPEPAEVNAGSADFSTFMVIGDSYAAGISSDGLDSAFEKYSVASLIAEQFKEAGGGKFNVPNMPEGRAYSPLQLKSVPPNVCDEALPIPRLQNRFDGNPNYDIDPAWENSVFDKGPFNNLGINRMALRSINDPEWGTNIFNNVDSINYVGPFLDRITGGNTSYADLVTQTTENLQPTFLLSWMGPTDILLHGASGGGYLSGNITLGAGSFFACDFPNIETVAVSENEVFRNNYYQLLQSIKGNAPNVQGLVVTIPHPQYLPFFNTINRHVLEDHRLKDGTNDTLSAFDEADCSARIPIWVTTEEGTRLGTDLDRLLLTAGYSIGKVPGINCPELEGTSTPHGYAEDNPLLHSEVLDRDERTSVYETVDEFNEIIREVADSMDFFLFDVNQVLADIDDGKWIKGVEYNSEFIEGGTYSLDGLHFTPKGAGIVANALIDRINVLYGSSLRKVDPNSLPGLKFP